MSRITGVYPQLSKLPDSQDASPPSGVKESEEETLMWQAIQSAVETSKEYEQRKTLVRHNSPESVRQAGMSPHLLIALDVLQMLVKVEQKNDTLKEKVDTARAVEESLCDRISMLEAQLSAKTGEISTNSHEIQLLLAQVRAIQTAVQHVKTDTSTIIDRLNTESRTPVPPPTPVTPNASPNHTLRASASKPSLLRKTSPPTPTTRAGPSQERPPPQYVQQAPDPSPQQEYFLPHARTRSASGIGLSQKQLMSPPMTPATPGKPLFVLDPPMTTRWGAAGREDLPVPAAPNPQSPRGPVASSSTIYQPPPVENLKPIPTPISTSSPANPFRSPKSPILSPTTPKPIFNSMPVPTIPSSFTQPPKPALARRLTTTHRTRQNPYRAFLWTEPNIASAAGIGHEPRQRLGMVQSRRWKYGVCTKELFAS
ncbi:Zinc finger, C3HC4 type (RING finger) protein [Ceratobasidium sp. AG-Ba]|nr:Zinc finger, C3HC4 type (RING finger) protein [Ceratobasidium sp. AG-Ba]